MSELSFKWAMGALSLAIMFAAYGIYLWQTARSQENRPHPFSWLLWGVVTGVAWAVQVTQGAGPGSWVVGFTALICFIIGGYSWLKYHWEFALSDWLSLAAAVGVFVIYLASRKPTLSAILATLVDLIIYWPTLRKGWIKPYSDSVTSFALNSAKFIPSLLALQEVSLATWLYPATLVVVNGGVAIMLLVRRQQTLAESTGREAVH